jgi:hypothetical protein
MSAFDTWFSRLANLLQVAGFNWKTDPVIGTLCGLLLAALRSMETISPAQVVLTFLACTVLVMTLLALWRVLRRTHKGGDAPVTPTTPTTPSIQGGGHSAPVMTAGENSQIHYTYNDNRTQLFVLNDQDKPTGPLQAKVTSLRMLTGKMELLNSTNVSSVTDKGAGLWEVLFAKPIDPKFVIVEVKSTGTYVPTVTAVSATVKVDELKTNVLDIYFVPKDRDD